jgi:excisionase family DNA binding protein
MGTMCSVHATLHTKGVYLTKKTPAKVPSGLSRRAPSPFGGDANPVDLLTLYLNLPDAQRAELFLSSGQTASLLTLSKSRVRGLIDEGKLSAVKVFGRLQIYKPAMLEALREQN